MISKPRFLMTNEERVAGFTKLEPGQSPAEVIALLGEPSKKGEEAEKAKSVMIKILSDPGNTCSVSSAPAFGKDGSLTGGPGTSWAYVHNGQINGRESLGGTIVLLLQFNNDKLAQASKLEVLSSLVDSTGAR
jgi:hypothetical protein